MKWFPGYRISRIFSRNVTVCGLTILMMANCRALPCLAAEEEIPPVVRKALPQVEIRGVEIQEFTPPLYTVTTSQGILYLDGTGRYLFTGELYDLKNGESLTQARLMETQRISFGELPLADAILYRKGKHRIALFVDPDCPYCRKLHPELVHLDAAVYVFLYPLTDLHPLAYRKAVSIWCSPDKVSALNTVMGELSVFPSTCEHPVDRTLALGRRLGIRATPTIILEDGRRIEGYRTAEELTRLLERDRDRVPGIGGRVGPSR
jgi:thiol:disulfide interchange protein DsbC